MKIIKRVLAELGKHQRFLITTHARCDGDGLGSELALAAMLKRLGKTAYIVNDGVPAELGFLPGVDKVGRGIKDLPTPDKYDALIILDAGGVDQLDWIWPRLPKNKPIINIDHHPSNDISGVVNWVNEDMAAVGEMVYRLILATRLKITKDIATCLYVSLDTDTGHFCFSNTTPYSHIMAARLLETGIKVREVIKPLYENKLMGDIQLFAECIRNIKLLLSGKVATALLTRAMFRKFRSTGSESQTYLTVLRSIKGVKVALLFRESERGPVKVKVSVRSEAPIDADKLMQNFGGGGHHRAAAATLKMPLARAYAKVISRIKKIL